MVAHIGSVHVEFFLRLPGNLGFLHSGGSGLGSLGRARQEQTGRQQGASHQQDAVVHSSGPSRLRVLGRKRSAESNGRRTARDDSTLADTPVIFLTIRPEGRDASAELTSSKVLGH